MMDLSIVIINYNSINNIKRCLDSIFKFKHILAFEIIYVDNGSIDGSCEFVQNTYKQIKVIKNRKNLGVAPARNQGLKVAIGRYILILDSDTEFIMPVFDKSVAFLDAHLDVGLVGVKLLYPNHDVQLSCKRFPTIKSLLIRRLSGFGLFINNSDYNRHIMSDFDHDKTISVDYVIGAFQLFRRELISRVGLLDDRIFYGPEDIDYCIRIRMAGYDIKYIHDLMVIHHEQRITKKRPISKITLIHIKNIIYFFNKYKWNISGYILKNKNIK